jgi:hypothetical protein
MLTRLLTIAASTALLAGAAHAQATSATGAAQTTGPAAVTDTTAAPSNPAATAPVDTTGYNSQSSTTATLPGGATVETQVVSNGPVPDTAENRAKYGKPDSHAGKRTAPAGN